MGNNVQFLALNPLKDAVVTLTSGGGSKNNLFDYVYYCVWASSGSSDSVTEEIELILLEAVYLDRVFLLNTNVKSGYLEYDPGTGFQNFGSTFNNTKQDKLVQHGSTVAVKRLKLYLQTTISANQDKRIGMLLPTSVLFEFNQNPDDWSIEDQQATNQLHNRRGLVNLTRNFESVRKVNLGFEHFLSGSDFDAVQDFERSRASFVLNMCGDSEQSLKGWDYKDLRRYVITNNVKAKLANNSIKSGIKQALVLEESVK